MLPSRAHTRTRTCIRPRRRPASLRARAGRTKVMLPFGGGRWVLVRTGLGRRVTLDPLGTGRPNASALGSTPGQTESISAGGFDTVGPGPGPGPGPPPILWGQILDGC